MLFNSFSFLFFLPVVFMLYWFVFSRRLAHQNILLLLASYFFYGWWSLQFLGLLILSTFLDYIYGFRVASANGRQAKLFLWLSIINNLGILAVFKYYNFFIAEMQSALGNMGIHFSFVLLQVALPVGISFYTFHGLSYVFDIYRRRIKPVENFVDYSLFVAFFPLLVAGPIERAGHLLPQVRHKRTFKYEQAVEGCRLILWGMFKKVVVADSLAGIADDCFNNYSNHNGVSLVVGAVAFSFQIYGDFSGYSDIALGSAKLFGFELLSNFRFPYFSRDIAEFWRRWHISLSSWFRDYLYIPLGGSKSGRIKTVRNIFVIFLVSGLWHGASWNFIAWGFLHACAFLPLLLLNRNRQYVSDVVAQAKTLPSWKEFMKMILTFSFVTLSWIFFRAKDIGSAIGYLQQALTSIVREPQQLLSIPQVKSEMAFLLPLVIGDWYFRHDERNLRTGGKWATRLIYVLCVMVVLSKFGKASSFIYFQF